MSFKAFELAPVIEKVVASSSDRPKTIECVDCAIQNLYVGTTDGYVLHYIIDDGVSPLGRRTFQYALQSGKHLGMKKPVAQVLTAPAINRLLVICDGMLLMFSMFGLEFIVTAAKDKLKGVSALARNDNPINFDPFSVEICMAFGKKKSIQLFSITEDKIIPLKEIPLPDCPLEMAIDGGAACIALANQNRYCMVDMTSGKVQDLFHYEVETTKPLIMKVGMEEFLLNGPTNVLGMFVTSEGTSQRAPLSWADEVQALGYSFPYILSLAINSVTVHSIMSQDSRPHKQSIPFKGGRAMLNYEGQVFVCSPREVYCLIQLPFHKQVQMLINERRVNEALQLAQIAMETTTGSARDEKLLSRAQQQAGLVYMAEGYFDEARELMTEGKLDPRELIVLFPSLLTSSWKYFPSKDLEEVKEISGLVKGSKRFLAEAKQFLLKYLEASRQERDYSQAEYKEEVDTALMKLYSEINSPELLELVSKENRCAYDDTINGLQKYKRYHALALFHRYHQESDKALDIWKRLGYNDISDALFPGLLFVANFLTSLQDYELMWNHVPWLLEKNQEIGVKVFTGRPLDELSHERLKQNLIIDYLQRFPIALQRFLEYLVFDQKIEKEKCHTHLAVHYLDEVLRMKRDPSCSLEQLGKSREKLKHMLEWSSLYRVTLLLGKISEDSDLDAESAVLYGKMEQHNKALKILVYKLKDFKEAQRYCDIYSQGKDKSYKTKLFHTLLTVYLQPDEGMEPFVAPAVSLLNSHTTDFDSIEVLKLVPEEWSIVLLRQFLTASLRTSLHRSRTSKLLKSFIRAENLEARGVSMVSNKPHLVVTDERLCQVCRRPFNDASVARYPNGVVTHIHCARDKSVCPISGRVFAKADL